MNRHRYFYTINGKRVEELVDGKWVSAQHQDAVHSHNIIRDTLGDGAKGVWNPATGKRYDSRSRYLQDTKAAGCEVIGNDHANGMRGPGITKNPEPVPETIERLSQQNRWNL